MRFSFSLLSLFLSRSKKYHHHALIRKSFDEYKNVYMKFTQKYPNYESTTDPLGKMLPDMSEASKKQTRIIKEFVANVEAFCVAYPDEPICKNCFIRDYKDYPHRLGQNIELVTDLLNKK